VSEVFRTSIDIAAEPDRVFDYFLKPELLVRWMGDFAQLEANPDGLFRVDINGVLIRGHFVQIERPNLLVIAWGEAGNKAMPPGATRLVIRLAAQANGTRLELEHSGLAEAEASKHAIGWPHFLDRLGILASGRDPGPDPWASSPQS
jgi:uncharacterized protein YndB with AHSA1/START domain